ncbi:MAG: deoxyribodipyrimidine photolyase [Phycisphaerae bacterium]|nr:deoxyribodipyrimidine photolyase [Phycisphaerae bacterium]
MTTTGRATALEGTGRSIGTDRIAVVWFKRDLRLHDHRALVAAAEGHRILPLFIREPDIARAEGVDPATTDFGMACAAELDRGLRRLGGRLVLRTGDAVRVLEELHRELSFDVVHAHEETGGMHTWDRDRAVARWCRGRGVDFIEHPQHGVIRRLDTRDGWAARWNRTMRTSESPDPSAPDSDIRLRFAMVEDPGRFDDTDSHDADRIPRLQVQPAGEQHALRTLDDFLHRRGRDYRGGMSSPVTAAEACSRISPHLAWGSLSIRRAHQAAAVRQAEVRELGRRDGWAGSLASFQSRLRWHCHFMQKLEDEPTLETRCMNPAFEGLREEWSEAHLEAWKNGMTGFPMVDAVMRSLAATGWATFRMRAMVVSFACHHLQIDWRPVGRHLAALFIDYEPGIHWSQCQMQAGVTGINTVRIYSPGKQVVDQDPTGVFIRKWVPELLDVPDEHLADPGLMPDMTQRFARCRIGRDYPMPLVDHATAYRRAREVIQRRRSGPGTRDASRAVQRKHGSRRRSPSRKR